MLATILVWGQSYALAASVCHHHSARAHAMARASGNLRVSGQALQEETAAKTAKEAGLLATTLLNAAVPPRATVAPEQGVSDPLPPQAASTPLLAGVTIPPLLRPPLF